jgi:hypothetical protein
LFLCLFRLALYLEVNVFRLVLYLEAVLPNMDFCNKIN